MRTPHALPRPRALLVALLALALLPLLVPRADAAPAPKVCPAGQLPMRVAVKATKKSGKAAPRTRVACRTVKLAGDPLARLRKVAPSASALRAAAPKRLRSRIPVARWQRAERALKAAATPRAAAAAAAFPRMRRVTAHAAAAGDCSGAHTTGEGKVDTEQNGVPVTGTAGVWGERDGATWGKETNMTADPGGGATIGEHQKDCVSWDTCPDADGVLHGEYHFIYEETRSAQIKGVSLKLTTSYKIAAELTGHVGADGRLTTFDWDAEGVGSVRAELRDGGKLVKYIPATTIRTVSHQTGADPRRNGAAPQQARINAWGAGGSVLDGTRKAAIDFAVTSLVHQTVYLPRDVSPGLLAAEKVFYDQAACLDVLFDPKPASASPNARIPVNVKVKAKDGAEVPATYDAQPVDGAVGPPAGTTPATVTWTAPDKVERGPFETFKIVAVSKRGRALGTHTAKGPEKGKWWTVTLTGAGEYHRYEPRGIPFPQLWSDHTFSYKMVSRPVRLPYFDDDPTRLFKTGSASVDLTGELHGKRTDGGGTDTCAAAADASNVVGWVDAQGGDGGFHLSVVPFPWLVPAPGTDCGTFEDMLHSAPGFEDGIKADTHVSQADLDGKDRIEIPVDSGAKPLSADCRGGAANGDWPCTHTISWKATLVLERTATPAGER